MFELHASMLKGYMYM